ncbi:MAG: tyrosine-type recombinase/integrase [Burkholderiaceae bacterium]
MATRLDTVDARDKLKPRPSGEPYWTRVAAGCQLGFRKKTAASIGSWVAKYRSEGGERTTKSLGEFEELPKSQRYDAAMKAAREWFEHLGMGGSRADPTVRDACERYVAHLRATRPAVQLSPYAMKRRKTAEPTLVPAAEDASKRFERLVYVQSKFSSTPLSKLTPAAVGAWVTSVRARPNAGGGNRTGARSDSALNRDMTAFRAALNRALDDGLVTSDFAWRAKLRPLKDADRSRELYLDKEQRRTLIAKASPHVAQFLRGLSLLPLRPGALAALTVRNFDKRRGLLTVGKDKHGKDRVLKLPESTAKFFAELTADKLPGAPLLARENGAAWDKDSWKGPVKEAVSAAKLPSSATAYTLRHSTISDLVHDGLDLLTVAQISGTSVRMIEKHYGHLRGDVAAQALAGLAL